MFQPLPPSREWAGPVSHSNTRVWIYDRFIGLDILVLCVILVCMSVAKCGRGLKLVVAECGQGPNVIVIECGLGQNLLDRGVWAGPKSLRQQSVGRAQLS